MENNNDETTVEIFREVMREVENRYGDFNHERNQFDGILKSLLSKKETSFILISIALYGPKTETERELVQSIVKHYIMRLAQSMIENDEIFSA